MKFFLDTANIADIESLMHLGIISGITTNPTIISREDTGKTFSHKAHYSRLLKIIYGLPLSVEVLATETEAMIAEAKELAKLGDNIVVKIPCTYSGISAITRLNKLGIRTNCTLIFSLAQANCAMLAGASYISPFIGRLEDIGADGLGLVSDCVAARDKYTYRTEIICTSIRSTAHIEECIRRGADIATCPPDYFAQLVSHPLTDKGLDQFMADYHKSIL